MAASALQAQTVAVAINCGGPSFTAGDGTVFSADTNYTGGNTYSTGAAISGTTNDVLYQSERWGTFSYNLPLANARYEVTLMFAEIYFSASNSRVFNVSLEGAPVSADLDIWAKVGKNAAYNEKHIVTVRDGQLNIALSSVTDNPKISAIKVVQLEKSVLFVVGNAANMSPSDLAISNRLQGFGYAVQVVSDALSTTADATGKDLVLISATVTSGNVSTKFRDVAVPVINWEYLLEDDFGFTGDSDALRYTVGSQSQINITNSAHPLAAGLSGIQAVVTTPSIFSWGEPVGSPIIIARLSDGSGHPCLYAYEAGAEMSSGMTASERRVHIFLNNDTFAALSDNGLKLFDAALSWAMRLEVPSRIQPPVVEGGFLKFQWLGGGMLQKSTNMLGTWIDIPGATSPYLHPIAGPMEFFRLKKINDPLPEKLFNNPIIASQGVCDPHIHIFDGKAYLFATHDEKTGNSFYEMYDWWVWSSADLVNWTLDFTLYPIDMWVGPTKNCWAVDAAERNGRHYFYVSGNWDTGVAVSTNGPAGPYRDALGSAISTTYDPTVFIDDDANRTPYLITGEFPYQIARLNENMISVAEQPRPIIHTTTNWSGDGNFLHKRNGTYYLNGHGSDYSTSTNVYGPYQYRGKYYVNWIDHPTFFNWNNQSYCAFGVQDGDPFYRKTFMTYVHYKTNGDMVADAEVPNTFIGVGQYDCSKTIQAEWYFAASAGTSKLEAGTGFVMGNITNMAHLYYPRILNVAAAAAISVRVSSQNSDSRIEVRKDNTNGTLLGTIKVPNTGSLSAYQTVTTNLSCEAGVQNFCLVFKGTGQVANLDWFAISSTGPIPLPAELLPKPCVPPPTAVPVSAYNQIEAENNICGVGVRVESCQDTGGGQDLGYIEHFGNAAYKVDFGSGGPLTFQARVASGNGTGGNIEIRLDNPTGPLIGTCVVPNTGGWQSWTTKQCNVSAASGVHVLYLRFTGGGGYLLNLNWIKFTP